MHKKVYSHPFFEAFDKLSPKQSCLIEGLFSSPKACLISYLKQTFKTDVLFIVGGEKNTSILNDFPYFNENPYDFYSWETLIEDQIKPNPDIIGERFSILQKLAEKESNQIIVTTLQGALQKVPTKDAILMISEKWEVGTIRPFSDLPKKLTDLGYERVKLVTDKGQFAVRGGIIDIFSVAETAPHRVEFFDDEIDEIRTFDPMGQKSIETVKSLQIFPTDEKLAYQESPTSLLTYLKKDAIIILDDLALLEDHYVQIKALSHGKNALLLTIEDLLQEMENKKRIYFTDKPLEELSTVENTPPGRPFFTFEEPFSPVSFDFFDLPFKTNRLHNPFQSIQDYFEINADTIESQSHQLLLHLGTFDLARTHPIFLTSSETEEAILKKGMDMEKIKKIATFETGYLSSGFVFPDGQNMIIPYTEFTKRKKISRKKWRTTTHTPVSEFHELSIGDLVVHFHNGIGKFLGMEKQKNIKDEMTEFLIIEYNGGSKLFVPVEQSHLVSRYIGVHTEVPELHQLGTKKWQTAKMKTQTAIIGYSKDLLEAQAKREFKGGYQYCPDSDMVTLFDDEFPYVETDDQLRAINDLKQDMVSNRAMDRLICGDVGYGKTEVAMRAAFKSVADGKKQVAILVPTTVLALQHYETISERMANFPINIGIVSRFQTAKENKETLKKLADGKVDILVGTHRLTSKDVIFKDLGLIIIDEEQRFGVRAKEKLKGMKEGVDCLTLSATPIPRTLYLSLIQLREMSVINSPPQDRLPIRTIIAENDNEVIKQALTRELSRDGQSYFIHNRVESIFDVKKQLQELVPSARIGVVHGQMDSNMIDTVFHAFKQGEIDVLVATSIVENGIDISNANTILIDRSHHFGISDLYQLRGRVGRWNKAAYAYFLTPKNKRLPEVSQKRLQALVEASGYGGGMKLAMRDLELRGAGDILGTKQSGLVSSIGFHLYCKLLKKTIESMRNKKNVTFFETKLDFKYPARIPDDYIGDSSLRLELYHRLGEASSVKEAENIFAEIEDRFGKAPDEVHWLYHMSRIRIFAEENSFTSLKFGPISITAEQKKKNKPITKTFHIPPPHSGQELELITKKRLSEEFHVVG